MLTPSAMSPGAKPSEMNVLNPVKPLLFSLNEADIPVSVVGEIVLNYYNVPRVVHDIEICVPELSLPEVASKVVSTTGFTRVEVEDYDLFTEYKRGFQAFKAPNDDLRLIIFPDSHFGIAPLRQSSVLSDERVSIACSTQILGLVPQCEIRDIPVPRLSHLFTGLCLRFFESGDVMARIAVEQLVDGMDLDDEWIKRNLDDTKTKVRDLATQLVTEKVSRREDDPVLGATNSDFVTARTQDIPTERQCPFHEDFLKWNLILLSEVFQTRFCVHRPDMRLDLENDLDKGTPMPVMLVDGDEKHGETMAIVRLLKSHYL